MPKDIVKNLSIGNPEWNQGPNPLDIVPGYQPPQQASMPEEIDWSPRQIVSGMAKVKHYFSPKETLKRGFYPVGTDQGPEPRLPSRRETGQMMGSVMDPTQKMEMDMPMAPAMTPMAFGRKIGQIKKGAKSLANMKSISDDAYKQASKTLDAMTKEFPPLARQRLKDIEVFAGKAELQRGVGGRYWPKRVQPPTGTPSPKIQVPQFGTRPGYTTPHEGGHHIFETIYELTGEAPHKFSRKFRAMVNEAVSEDLPRRVGFFGHYDKFVNKAESAVQKGFITRKQASALSTRFLEGYKRAIPHEMFANTYHRALKEGLKGEEAVRVSLKAIINNRERMRKLAANFSMYEKKLSERLDELVRVSKKAQKLEFPKTTVRPLGGK